MAVQVSGAGGARSAHAASCTTRSANSHVQKEIATLARLRVQESDAALEEARADGAAAQRSATDCTALQWYQFWILRLSTSARHTLATLAAREEAVDARGGRVHARRSSGVRRSIGSVRRRVAGTTRQKRRRNAN